MYTTCSTKCRTLHQCPNSPHLALMTRTWAGYCYVFHFARNVVLPSGKVVAFAYFVRTIEALRRMFYAMVEAKRPQVVKRIICLYKVAFVKFLPVPFFATVS
ncbi:hypothetical protein CGGC5_v007163 [Colletotrichum fructicola Nara gc5]|uniref:Uncharacterized protein n=1 Tax=Colletotrichum fructicola (strain Nara gc5) TaxID=1213859 RepID=A0A7J6J6N8_COLFN|nr:hypothetical protein CGGC5_v007163 [Colletotrichum fructicola Nara gc5]